MNDKNNFIPRNGASLFYPTDPEKGFQGGGKQSRRKFLKRTGGVSLVAFLGALSDKAAAHPNHGDESTSKPWVMKYLNTAPGLVHVLSIPVNLRDTIGNTYEKTLSMLVSTTIWEDQDIVDTNEIDYEVTIEGQIHDPNSNFNESTSVSYDVTVKCPQATGHLTLTSQMQVTNPPGFLYSFEFMDVQHTIIVDAAFIPKWDPDPHFLGVVFDGSVGFTNGIDSYTIPGENLNGVVSSFFESYQD